MTPHDPHKPAPGAGAGRSGDDLTEALFDLARAQAPDLPPALEARILADAQAVRPAKGALGFWRDRWHRWGGMPALGGMVSATVVGFWLGIAPPEGLPDLAGQLVGTPQQAALAQDEEAGVDLFGTDLFATDLFGDAFDFETGLDPEEG